MGAQVVLFCIDFDVVAWISRIEIHKAEVTGAARNGLSGFGQSRICPRILVT